MTDTDGPLVLVQDGRAWAWTAVEVTEAHDPSRSEDFARLGDRPADRSDPGRSGHDRAPSTVDGADTEPTGVPETTTAGDSRQAHEQLPDHRATDHPDATPDTRDRR